MDPAQHAVVVTSDRSDTGAHLVCAIDIQSRSHFIYIDIHIYSGHVTWLFRIMIRATAQNNVAQWPSAAEGAKAIAGTGCRPGRIPKGAFVRWAMQLLSVTVQRGNAEMYRRSGLVISREQGLRYDAAFAVPLPMS